MVRRSCRTRHLSFRKISMVVKSIAEYARSIDQILSKMSQYTLNFGPNLEIGLNNLLRKKSALSVSFTTPLYITICNHFNIVECGPEAQNCSINVLD